MRWIALLVLMGWSWAIQPQTQALLQEAQNLTQQARAAKVAPSPDAALWKQAIAKAEEASRLEPTALEVWKFLGLIYSETRWWIRADTAWQQYLKVTGGRPDGEARQGITSTYLNLGYAAYRQNNLGAAKRHFELAAQVSTTNPAPLEWLGRIALVQGNTAAAKEFYQQANLLEPTETNRYFLNQANNMQAYGQAAVGAFLAGYEKYQLGDKAGALSGFEQATQQSPNWLEAWRWVGRIRLELDRPKEALTAWQQVALSPQVTAADRYFLRLAELSSKYGAPAAKTFFEGMGLYQAGKKPEAQARFLAATQANLQFVEAWYWLGRVAFEQNNFQLALTAFGEVLKLEPDNKDAQYWLIQAKRLAR